MAPWGFVLLLFLALLETYRLAALWGEEDVDKRVYPGMSSTHLQATLPTNPLGLDVL